MRPVRLTRGVVFATLLVLAGVISLLPGSCTHWMRSPFQVLALPQWVVLRGVQRVSDEAGAADGEAQRLSSLERENKQLRLSLGQQRLWLEDLERRYQAICGLRGQMWSDRVELVIAPVLGFDASPWHETMEIGRGADNKLAVGQWVAAGRGLEGWQSGAEFLLQRCIIGRISEVQTHVSRVELVSDPGFRAEVAPVKVLADGAWQLEPRCYVITGGGRGRMLIRQADENLKGLGFSYLALPAGSGLPATLSLGQIRDSRKSAQSALHFDIDVDMLAKPGRLHYVAIIVVPS